MQCHGRVAISHAAHGHTSQRKCSIFEPGVAAFFRTYSVRERCMACLQVMTFVWLDGSSAVAMKRHSALPLPSFQFTLIPFLSLLYLFLHFPSCFLFCSSPFLPLPIPCVLVFFVSHTDPSLAFLSIYLPCLSLLYLFLLFPSCFLFYFFPIFSSFFSLCFCLSYFSGFVFRFCSLFLFIFLFLYY